MIVEYGIQWMYDEKHDKFFDITLMNESYPLSSLPDGVADDLIRGLYRCIPTGPSEAPCARLLALEQY